jgi:hypothetical protein
MEYTHKSLYYMARLAGFEPATYGLEVRCSIQLSYRRFFVYKWGLFTPFNLVTGDKSKLLYRFY